MKEPAKAQEAVMREKERLLQYSAWSLLRTPLIRTRSQLIADSIIVTQFPALNAAETTLVRANTRFDLLRIAIALKRYESTHGTYPVTLEDLVTAFLEDVPLDPFTGRATLTYKLAPDEETAFLLYSFGQDEIDDSGSEDDIVLRMAKTVGR